MPSDFTLNLYETSKGFYVYEKAEDVPKGAKTYYIRQTFLADCYFREEFPQFELKFENWGSLGWGSNLRMYYRGIPYNYALMGIEADSWKQEIPKLLNKLKTNDYQEVMEDLYKSYLSSDYEKYKNVLERRRGFLEKRIIIIKYKLEKFRKNSKVINKLKLAK